MTYSLVPESAPFTPDQRAWLNGFLAGWIGLESGSASSGVAVVQALVGAPPAPIVEPEEHFPWHDPALSIDERLERADGKPLERRLMAAMAQLNCGACGYLCKTYSEAVAAGTEKSLTLCSPGGRDTAKAIKRLLAEHGSGNANGSGMNGSAMPVANGHAATGALEHGGRYHRGNPFAAKFVSTCNLNKPGSAKHTAHVILDLTGSGLTYKVGDALGVCPTNPPDLVDAILEAARIDGESPYADDNGKVMSLRELLRRRCLRAAPEELAAMLAERAVSETEQASVHAAVADETWESFDVLDALRVAPSATLTAAELVAVLPPLAPRLYSIASSPKAHPGEVHLAVGRVAYRMNCRERLGVASTMFADRLRPGDAVDVFIHASAEFTVPADPNAAMIMVGPGTGIAPFRAFLGERHATGARGKNWLFFGDQSAATDSLYHDELEALREAGCLTRLERAFSRDQVQKIYVQDRMRTHGEELFRWLEQGAYFFVCGDAKRMALDVDRALHDVIATHGGMAADDAKAYVATLKAQKRYVRDVY